MCISCWAGVLGRSCPAHDHSNLAPEISAQQLQETLDSLGRKDLLVAHKTSAFAGTQAYSFKHALLHDVVYANIQGETRRIYHGLVAGWLATQAGTAAGLIGEHYEHAGETLPAVEWYKRAAQQARYTYAQAAALTFYRKQLALVPEEADYRLQRLQLYQQIGETCHIMGHCAEAIAAFTTARTLAEAVGDLAAQSRAWTGLAAAQQNQGDLQKAVVSIERAEAAARAANSPHELFLALTQKGWLFYILGGIQTVFEIAEQILALSVARNDQYIRATGLNRMGVAFAMQGQAVQATAYHAKALALYRDLGYREGIGHTLIHLGVDALRQGDYATAARYYQEALVIDYETGDRRGEFLLYHNLSRAWIGLGQYTDAEAEIRRALAIAEAERWPQAALYARLAEAYLGQGRMFDAVDAGQQAVDLAQKEEEPLDRGWAWRALGLALAQTSDFIGAGPCFAQSVCIFQSIGSEDERALTLWEWSHYELSKGDKQQGETLWQEARDLFARLGFERQVARMVELPNSVAARLPGCARSSSDSSMGGGPRSSVAAGGDSPCVG